MPNRFLDDYDPMTVIQKMGQIDEQYQKEVEKPVHERDRDAEFKLIYRKFIQGLKLCTGVRF